MVPSRCRTVSMGSERLHLKQRLRQQPRPPHNQRPKKQPTAKKSGSWSKAFEHELARLLSSPQDGLRCSPNRGMISTKLHGR